MHPAPHPSVIELVHGIEHAARVLDRPRVNALAGALIARLRAGGPPLPGAESARLLGTLRRKRLFEPMERLADALVQTGADAPVVRRQLAQALIERGSVVAATAVLRQLDGELAAGRHGGDAGAAGERPEVRGLLGRACKQQYVSAGRPGAPRVREALVEAVRLYHEAYAEAPARHHWHGINAVACLARARRDGVPVDAPFDERQLAADLLARLEPPAAPPPASAWDAATALEGWVALGDGARAEERARRYAAHGDADAFELASTLRQLVEVWELDATRGIGALVLPVLQDALLRRTHGHVELSAAEVASGPTGLERVFGAERFRTLAWYARGLARARLVARIATLSGNGLGTGFLAPGEALVERLRGRWVLLTNAHVVGDPDANPAAHLPSEVVVTFEAEAGAGAAPTPRRVRRALWSSGRGPLDTTVLELDAPAAALDDGHRCEVAERLPATPSDRIYIIGHPLGGSLRYSLQDNQFLGWREPLLHYRTPTETGSSGSPLFDDEWRLIGIHHAGSHEMPRLDGEGSYAANEGISMHAIRAALAASELSLGDRPD